jgi:hypothetical protein
MKKSLKILIIFLIIFLSLGFIWAYDVFGVKNLTGKIIGNFLNECPQIDIPLKHNILGYYISNTNNVDNYQNGWTISVYSSAEGLVGGTDEVYCHKGDSEGENPTYFYCDTGMVGGISYIRKTKMNSDGTIGETIRKSFVNIYNGNSQFIKTICGKSPEEISEENFKETMREVEDFFNLD